MIATSPTTQPTPPAVAQPRRWSTSRLGDGQFATLLTLPVIVVLGLVVAYPTLYSLWMSFQRIDLIFGTTEAVGFANYRQALTSPEVWHSVRVTLLYTALVTIFAVAIAVGGALLLNERFRGRGFLMALVILPWAVSLYATAVVWKYIYSPEWGLLNAVLQQRLGLSDGPILFLSERGAVPALAVAHAWQIAPLGMYFVLATLQVIPEDLYKAAKVDRLGAFGRFRHVVLPYIKTPLSIVMVLITVEAARVFDIIFFMTNGGPGDASTTLTWDIYRQSFVNRNLGYGAAVAWILVVLTTIITTVYFLLLFRNREKRPDKAAVGEAT
ncbi:MAG: N-Acetyl-D-glucosamine ABC transport system, permease protein 1 [uncultured Thermomicrobiales bacterium]|uniref:N-Acetyl-D-glucosamine ABC transport system, permease protein 1 n=1 Tax=uncultured Thermomicrobiales bacterium TaxID=1645740 RepID=A0A6J4VPK6_9BACT|nr:MAG: N-Acetyl-D-glucosamine ABC transport system, permease protein 1 [uncultured Thermomicrobiales bacterium]